MLFGTTVIDQLIWLAVLVLVARALRTGGVATWLLAGAVIGIGWQNKYTIAVLLVGLAVGLLAYRRDVLPAAGPWLAVLIAVLLAAPNVAWDAAHGWPSVGMARLLSERTGGVLGSLAGLPMLAVVFAGPLLVLLWIFGVRSFAAPDGREHRWVLVTVVVVLVIFTGSGRRPYYAAPMLAALFAAGAVRIETTRTAGLPRGLAEGTARIPVGWAAALGLSFVLAALACLPVLPISAANALRQVHPELVETYGWPELTQQVAAAASQLPAEAPVFTSNYGDAGALTILGPAAALHRPVHSGHSNYALWGPPEDSPDTVLCVGEFSRRYLEQFWSRVEPIALITLPEDARNKEITGLARIYRCEQPRGCWAQMWPGLSHLS